MTSNKTSSLTEIIYTNEYYRSAMFYDEYIAQFVSNNKISSLKDIDYSNGKVNLYSKKDMAKIDYENIESCRLLVNNYMDLLQSRIRS